MYLQITGCRISTFTEQLSAARATSEKLANNKKLPIAESF
ncbi:unnamed protein product [Tenebrio molitor]|nr:unnamed protein product [Tenebrio molitor]